MREEAKCGETSVEDLFGRPRHRGENNNKMDFQAIGLEGGGLVWIYLTQDKDIWRGMSCVVEERLASEGGLCSVKIVY
jgi:hypothetical protein